MDSVDTRSSFDDTFESDLSTLSIPGFEDGTPKKSEEAVATAESDAATASSADVVADPKKELAAATAAAVMAEKPEATGGEVAAKPAIPGKQISFKAGDNNVTLADDAVTEWKVDGKVQPVKVSELLENYAGKVAWDRKFQELATQRKQTAAEVQNFDSLQTRHKALINDMHKSAAEGKVFEAVQSMIDMSGLGEKVDARQYVKDLRDSLMKQATEMAKLSPEQREVYESKEEQQYIKSKYEQMLQQREKEQGERAFQDRVAKAMESANTSVEEYVNTRDWLVKTLKEQNGNVSLVTPEYVANQIRDVRDYRSAKEALDSVDPSLIKNEKLWDQAVSMLRANPDWTQADLKEIFAEATQKKRSQVVSNKVAASPVATVAKAGTKAGKTKSQREDYSVFTEADVSW